MSHYKLNIKTMFSEKDGRYVKVEEKRKQVGKHERHELAAGVDETRSQFFGKEMIMEMMGRDGCVGLKMIFARDEEEDRPELVIAPVNEHGVVVARDLAGLKDDDEGDAGADGPRCPKACY